jgi:2-polyprenyl-6-hydroxyphenyl methylase/3-demethylubiquinone-9 3-methyltransferase
VACKICGAAAAPLGAVDFNKSCEEPRGALLPPAGVAIPYRRCAACGFVFTDSFDAWTNAEFARHIYNAHYAAIDPEGFGARPAHNAKELLDAFAATKSALGVLDYGGGTGILARALREGGFTRAETYDPFVAEHAALPPGPFDIVTCYETLEHHPRPLVAIREMAERTAKRGIVIFSTAVQPAIFDRIGLGWWYIAPRNGHISIFSRHALALAWRGEGMAFGSIGDTLHVAFRNLPDFARHLFKKMG